MTETEPSQTSARTDRIQRGSVAKIWSLVIAGLFAAIASARILCGVELFHTLPGAVLLPAALGYVFVGALAGGATNWALWSLAKPDASLRLNILVLNSSVGWVFVPAVVLLIQLNSVWAALVASTASGALAFCLRDLLPPRASTASQSPQESTEVFATLLRSEPWNWHGLGLAICLYGALFAIGARSAFTASTLLAISAFAFSWQLAPKRESTAERNRTATASRLSALTVLAVFITAVTLLPRVRSSYFVNAAYPSARRSIRSAEASTNRKGSQSMQSGPAYVGIILWPVTRRKEILQPILSRSTLQPRHLATSLIIPFDGPYWYFQAPGKWPGKTAHMAYASPIAVDIHSNDLLPLVMEAHQSLGTSIDLSHCGEIQVAIQNGDYRPGRIALGILLTDLKSSGKPSQYLGAKPVLSSEALDSSLKVSPEREILTFQVPSHAKVHQFDEITVVFFPDAERSTMGSKIAIQQFELLPR